MTRQEEKDARTLDLITHEIGLAEMEERRPHAEDSRWSQNLVASMNARIGEYRRNRLPQTVPIKKAAPLSERLLAMSREVLEALFASLTQRWGADMQVAHRDLDVLSDNDLRRMIQTFEEHSNQE